MARKVEYTIHGKDKSKSATSSARKNLDSLASTAKLASATMKTAFAAVGITTLVKSIGTLLDKYGEQQQAELRLTAAALNNPLINGKAVNGLKDYAASLQKVSIFGDEALIQQASFLTTLQLSEEQIKGVLSAAVNLASTGMVSLESAVKNIAKTYGGMAGELGELIPQLRELTAEEMKAGEAVKLIEENYDGMAEAAASGINGIKASFKNLIGDFLEPMGKAIEPAFTAVIDAIRPKVEEAIEWLEKHSDKISNFFIYLPEIAAVSARAVADMFKEVFDTDTTLERFSTKWDRWNERNRVMMVGNLQIMAAKVKQISATIFAPFKVSFEWIIYGIKVAWQSMIDVLVLAINAIVHPIEVVINGLIAGINKVIDGLNFVNPLKDIRHIGEVGINLINRTTSAGDVVKPTDTTGALKNEADAEYEKTIKEIQDKLSWYNERIQDVTVVGGDLSGIANKAKADIEAILNRQLVRTEDAALTLLDATENTKESAKIYLRGSEEFTEGNLNTTAGSLVGQFGEWVREAARNNQLPLGSYYPYQKPPQRTGSSLSQFTEYGAWGKDVTTGHQIGKGEQALMDFGGGFMEGLESAGSMLTNFGGMGLQAIQALMSIENVGALFNWFGTILDEVIKVIGPVMNELLAPLVGILKVVGQTIGAILVPALKVLTPVIDWVATSLIFLYNYAIRPLANIIIFILSTLNNVIAIFVNAVIDAINSFKSKKNQISYTMEEMDFEDMKLQKIKLEDVSAEGTSEQTFGSSSSGVGASYTGAPTNNFYITYTIGQLAGDDGIDRLILDNNERLQTLLALG